MDENLPDLIDDNPVEEDPEEDDEEVHGKRKHDESEDDDSDLEDDDLELLRENLGYEVKRKVSVTLKFNYYPVRKYLREHLG